MFTVSIRDKCLQWLHPSTLFALFFWPIEAQLLHLWETRQVEINLNYLLMWRKMSAEVHRMVSLVIAGCRATQSSWCSHRPNHYNIYADTASLRNIKELDVIVGIHFILGVGGTYTRQLRVEERAKWRQAVNGQPRPLLYCCGELGVCSTSCFTF